MLPAEPAVLQARALVKRFGPSSVLRGIDVSVGAGQLLMVLGENGSGKTTLLRILAGLLRPTSGGVTLQGSPFLPADVEARRHVGFLSHRTHMYDELTVRENLGFAARLFGFDRSGAVVERALAESRLEEKGNQRLGSLSRGMQQRAALARAFLHSPTLLLLDEPFTALDSESADRVREWISTRLSSGCAIAMVTHQPEALWDLATHVGVLASGRWAILEPRPSILEEFQPRFREVTRV
jgi:heme ABC exporter ATP-binding subunit CcmA